MRHEAQVMSLELDPVLNTDTVAHVVRRRNYYLLKNPLITLIGRMFDFNFGGGS